MYRFIGILVVIAIVVCMVIKMARSKKFENFCDDLVDGKTVDTETSSKDTIKSIGKAEKDLSKKVEGNTKEAEKLQKETKDINNYLDDRGVGNSESEGSETT